MQSILERCVSCGSVALVALAPCVSRVRLLVRAWPFPLVESVSPCMLGVRVFFRFRRSCFCPFLFCPWRRSTGV